MAAGIVPLTLSLLIVADDNIVTKDGFRYWSTGKINWREGCFQCFYVYNAKKRKGLDTAVDDLKTKAFEFF